MKRLDIIVEGYSEREFISEVFAPYLESHGIIDAYNVSPIMVRTNPNHRGGATSYTQIKSDILTALHSANQRLVVSMLIDFFGRPSNLPSLDRPVKHVSDYEMADAIEAAIAEDIGDSRFIPYLQMHEFEAFLFVSMKGFEYCYNGNAAGYQKFKSIIEKYENPEDINTTPAGAPSKRILSIIPDYDKVIHGNTIIMENGLDMILAKCPRFRAWVDKLVEKLS